MLQSQLEHHVGIAIQSVPTDLCLTLNLLTTTIVAPPSNASKWQMAFNSAFKGLTIMFCAQHVSFYLHYCYASSSQENDIKINNTKVFENVVTAKSL